LFERFCALAEYVVIVGNIDCLLHRGAPLASFGTDVGATAAVRVPMHRGVRRSVSHRLQTPTFTRIDDLRL
jgi:hypothetical protein